LGPQGLKRLAQINYSNAGYLRDLLCQVPGVKRRFSEPHFNEFVLRLPRPAGEVVGELRQKGILGGIDVSSWGPGMENTLLVCATEMNTKEQMDLFSQTLREVLA
ncbi:MAG: glycine dehydrogenase, partial [bacterium]|nr:glycine dehydrogenase [bacterium]